MFNIKDLESFINEFNIKQGAIIENAKKAEQEIKERKKKFMDSYKAKKTNEIKPEISHLIQSLNTAIGIKAEVNYIKNTDDYVGDYEGTEITISRDDKSSLTFKISPNIMKENIVISFDRNPGFGDDKKLELAVEEFSNAWLNDFIITEFKKFLSTEKKNML